MPKQILADIKKQFPKGKTITFGPGRGAPDITAKVIGHHESGEPGTKGYSVFIDTEEDRGQGLVPRKRSVRPGMVRVD